MGMIIQLKLECRLFQTSSDSSFLPFVDGSREFSVSVHSLVSFWSSSKHEEVWEVVLVHPHLTVNTIPISFGIDG